MRPSPRLLLPLALLASLLAMLVAVPQPAQAAVSPAAYLVEARKHTNHARTSRNVRALTNSECLARYARAQAARIARDGTLSHQDLGRIMRACGLDSAGENVAQAAGSDTGRGVVAMWMGSEGHRANILNRGYSHYGMGAVYRDGKWWVAQVFGHPA